MCRMLGSVEVGSRVGLTTGCGSSSAIVSVSLVYVVSAVMGSWVCLAVVVLGPASGQQWEVARRAINTTTRMIVVDRGKIPRHQCRRLRRLCPSANTRPERWVVAVRRRGPEWAYTKGSRWRRPVKRPKEVNKRESGSDPTERRPGRESDSKRRQSGQNSGPHRRIREGRPIDWARRKREPSTPKYIRPRTITEESRLNRNPIGRD